MYGPGLLLGLVTVSELDIQSDPCVHGLREERERGCAAAAFTNQRDRFLDISHSCPDHLYSFVMSNEFVF